MIVCREKEANLLWFFMQNQAGQEAEERWEKKTEREKTEQKKRTSKMERKSEKLKYW